MIRAFLFAFATGLCLVACNGWDDDTDYYPENAVSAVMLLQDTSITDSNTLRLAIAYRAGLNSNLTTLDNDASAFGVSNILTVDGNTFWLMAQNGRLQELDFPMGNEQQSTSVSATTDGAMAIGRQWMVVSATLRDNLSQLFFIKRSDLRDKVVVEVNDRILTILANRDEFYLFGQDSMYVVDENAKAMIARTGYALPAVSIVGTPSIGDGITISAGLQLQDGAFLRVAHNTNSRNFSQETFAAGSDAIVTQTRSPFVEDAFETEFLGSVSYFANGTTTINTSNAQIRYPDEIDADFLALDFLRSHAYYHSITDTTNLLLVDDLKTPDGAMLSFELPEHHIPVRVLPMGNLK